jgi:ABC-2 type transport system ATP-binding protein
VKRFGDVRAVDDVDVTVGAGDRVALLGPNGAGKTTTLLMLLGAIVPDAGTVEIGGHLLPRGRSNAMEQVGFVAGYLPLPDRLRVREALSIFGGFYGLSRQATETAVERELDRLRIEHLADRLCMELSSGQQTLVGMAKGLLHRPRLLVLDEPTASLDPDVAQRVRRRLLEVWEGEGTALVVTSHNMTEVELLSDRVIFLAAGRVVANGPAEQVVEDFGRASLEDLFVHLAETTAREDR